MAKRLPATFDIRRVELDGTTYVILRESHFEQLCEMAGLESTATSRPGTAGLEMDRATLSDKLIRRRRAVGLSQAELARRAGIRPETLNRIERGHTTPDFATVRKLAVAIGEEEHAQAEREMKKQN